MKSSVIFSLILLTGGCTSYSGGNLKPGQSDLRDILGTMGEPAMRWNHTDGSSQLAYPRGPFGTATFMVHLDAQGKLLRIENVLNIRGFSHVESGMDKASVLKALGPPIPDKTVYFKARDELVWEWRYCDDWNQFSRFYVLFDGTSGLVRSAQTLPELCEGPDCRCGQSR